MPSNPGSGRLWAITSYYNPVPYRRRLENYRIFRERLGIPLLTVELVYGKTPELGEGDADILVQLRGRDVMWQKERLLNLAVGRLPAACDKVAWLDCDVFYEDPDWATRLERLLDDLAVVEAYRRVHYLSRDWRPGMPVKAAVELTRTSVCQAVADGISPIDLFRASIADRSSVQSSGFAWGARRALLARHGLYDAAIAGGGDRLLSSACFGRHADLTDIHHMRGGRRTHYLAWAEGWHAAVAGSVGVLDADVFNLWHGEFLHRRDLDRQVRLDALGFDPNTDIAHDEQGAWRWSSDKPELHAFLHDYFVGRREDG